MKNATNAEVAKWFASLPPDETASLQLINGDTGTIDDEVLRLKDVETFEDYDGTPPEPGEPFAFQKW